MNILWLCFENTSNVPSTISRAINKYTKHHCSLVIEAENYIKYDAKGAYRLSNITSKEFVNMVRDSDVIHFNELMSEITYPFRTKFKDDKQLDVTHLFDSSQKVLIHNNGTIFRRNSVMLNAFAKAHNVGMTISTPDLFTYGNNLTWLPAPIDLTNSLYKFNPAKFDNNCLISHSPTRRDVKGTDLFMNVCNKYFSDTVKPVLIEHSTHKDCMRKRKVCHAHYDQWSIGAYGVSALEGLAIGQIVMVGISDYVSKYLGTHRFINVCGNEESFSTSMLTLLSLLSDDTSRYNHLLEGRKWLERSHSDKVVVKNIIELYESSGCWVM